MFIYCFCLFGHVDVTYSKFIKAVCRKQVLTESVNHSYSSSEGKPKPESYELQNQNKKLKDTNLLYRAESNCRVG